MKYIYNLLLIACMSVVLASCQNNDAEAIDDGGYGYLTLTVTTDISTLSRDYDPTQLAIQIVNDNTNEVAYELDDFSSWSNSPIELSIGTYTITASSYGFDGQSGFDNAYYYGSTQVTISKDEEVTASITCTLANLEVSVSFDDDFLSLFSDANVTVQDVEGKYDAQTFTIDEEDSAYFPSDSGDLLVTYTVTNLSGESQTGTYTIEDVQARYHYIICFSVELTGNNIVTVTLGANNEYTFNFILSPEPSNTASLSANAWSTHAYLTATNITASSDVDLSSLVFQYKESSSSDWSDGTEVEYDEDTNEATATVYGLTPETDYDYRLVDNDGNFSVASGTGFTTEGQTELENGSFEDWYQDGDVWYVASSDSYSSDEYNWDTSNPAAAGISLLGEEYNSTTRCTSPVKDGTYSAQLETQYINIIVVQKIAAASLYYGRYQGLKGMSGAYIQFGRPFTSRPTALTGYFQYAPEAIDIVGDDQPSGTVSEGDDDICSIYIALSKEQYTVDNTEEDTYIDYENDDNIIAYGELPAEECVDTGGEWEQFNIPLKYKALDETPEYLIIVCSSSKYGDYFTGGTGSLLYLDAFELVYGDSPTLWE